METTLSFVDFCIALLLLFIAFGGGIFAIQNLIKPGAPEFIENKPYTSYDKYSLNELDVDDRFIHAGLVYTIMEKKNGWVYALHYGDEPHSKSLPTTTEVRIHLK